MMRLDVFEEVFIDYDFFNNLLFNVDSNTKLL